eukprot:m.6067 g.6067  ORF g.6067 m.6067 type:complete len:67 (+) comp4622_c0_seq1:589-789(+)
MHETRMATSKPWINYNNHMHLQCSQSPTRQTAWNPPQDGLGQNLALVREHIKQAVLLKSMYSQESE